MFYNFEHEKKKKREHSASRLDFLFLSLRKQFIFIFFFNFLVLGTRYFLTDTDFHTSTIFISVGILFFCRNGSQTDPSC